MHVAWGRQLLDGRLPVRDMVALGLPLKYALSAASEWAVGYRLLSEGLVIGAAFATGAVLTFALARKASGRAWVGVLAATLQLAVAPRTYNFSKIFLYGAAILVLWRYIDRPNYGRAVVAAALVCFAFYMRHDHGLYIGLGTIAVIALSHARQWRTGLQHAAVVGIVCAILVGPYLAYVQWHGGIPAYFRDLGALAAREYQQNHFDGWPRWPLPSRQDVIAWSSPDTGAIIGVRWNAEAPEQTRREAATRYGLQVQDDGPLTSGRFVLTNTSRENVISLLRDPAVEDTAGVNRENGVVPRQGLWVGPVRVLAGLDQPPEAATLLFFAVVACLTLTTIAIGLQRGDRGPLAHERLKIAAVVVIGTLTANGFIREPLAIRIADAVVAPLILAAWWMGVWLNSRTARGRPWSRTALTSAVLMVVTIPLVRSVTVVGGVQPRLERLQDWRNVWDELTASPPFDVWKAPSGAKYQAVRYVRACTDPSDPLLVMWFAPDLYYYADRPFAGRLGFYMQGYWASDENQRSNVAALERDRPVIALVESGREETDLYTYPQLLAYIADNYQVLGDLSGYDRPSIRVLARNDRLPLSTDPELGWPCFRRSGKRV